MSAIVTLLLLVSIVNAKVLPRNVNARTTSIGISSSLVLVTESLPFFPSDVFTSTNEDTSFVPPTFSPTAGFDGTIFIPIPTQASDYTRTTVTACTKANGETIDSIVVIGIPTGTFSAGTKTIVVPPQADSTTITYYDEPSNQTEVIVVEPLPGTCGNFVPPDRTTDPTSEGVPTATEGACPKKGCTGALLRTAETVIDAINDVTLLSMNLQSAAKKIGQSFFPNADMASPDAALGPITDVALGLIKIVDSLQSSSVRFLSFPPFLPPSCSSETIVVAWLDFIRVHQQLLGILIGQSGLLTKGPIKRHRGTSIVNGNGALVEREQQGFIGKPVAAALRGVEAIVDTIAVKLVDLVPNQSACTKAKTAELKKSIREAQEDYDG